MNTPTIFIAAAAAVTLTFAPLAVLTSGSASAGPAQSKIIINGQELANAGGPVTCAPNSYNPHNLDIHVGGNFVSLSDATPPEVVTVVIELDTGDAYMFQAPYMYASPTRGDAQANKSGNTYQITGHISTTPDNNAPLVPFEFDATCP